MGLLALSHPAVQETFLRAMKSQRLHHAWILWGRRGMGKATFAERMAAYLLEGEHESQQDIQNQIKSNTHANFLRISPLEEAKTLPLERLKEVAKFVNQTSANGEWKVVLIDSLNDLNLNGMNALLKTLEEPTDKTLFFLVAHEGEGAILPTIRSRCCLLPFYPLNETSMESLFEGSYSPEQKTILCRLSQGSPGTLRQLQQSHVLELREDFLRCLTHILNKDTPVYAEVYPFVDAVLKEEKFSVFVLLLREWFHQTIKTGTQRIPFHQLMDVHDFIFHLVNSEKTLHLDQRQTLLAIFFKMEELREST